MAGRCDGIGKAKEKVGPGKYQAQRANLKEY
jgi:hypothetical protein